jgi:arginyl-tRNA synthetase
MEKNHLEQSACPSAPAADGSGASVQPDILDFDPVPLRPRIDGLTPAKQREFVEALADSGLVRVAAARIGVSEQAINRVRRRADARAFDRACAAALRIGARRLVSVAFERAIEGTVKYHTYHGEIVSEQRVYDNRLLMALIGKLPGLFEEDTQAVAANWQPWMDAIEQGLPEPAAPAPDSGSEIDPAAEWTGEEAWERDGEWWTSFPPPEDFDGEEGETGFGYGYARTLSPAERAVIEAELAAERAEALARRDRFFGFGGGEFFDPWEYETSETSAEPAGDSVAVAGLGARAAGGSAASQQPNPSDDAALPRRCRPLEQPDSHCSRDGPAPLPPCTASNLVPPPLRPAPSPMRTDDVTLYGRFADHLHAVLDALEAEGALPGGLDRSAVTVEPPRDPSHGDLAVNAAMVLAKRAGTSPRALAGLIVPKLGALPGVAAAEIAGPGFINIRLDPAIWHEELRAILAGGEDYGRSRLGQGTRINVEYVSANPTGPMHMGHCRGAVVGDALANLLEYAGYAVTREYYVNDAGGQVDTLARSVWLRYREALGETIGEIPEGLYPGDYLVPVGQALAAEYGDRYAAAPETEWLVLFRQRAVSAMLDLIRADLAKLGVHHDLFSSEAEVQASGAVDRAAAALEAKGLVYRGVLEPPKGKTAEDWEPVELTLFRSTAFGDDQDRPLKKSDGSWTYFGADTAYHMQKLEASDELINIWGADHTGTVKRTQAAVEALAGRPALDVKLVQMVRLLRAGEPVKMSKRSGSFVTLAEVVDEVGKDVVRFTMLTRKNDAQMDFDFAKVVEASKDNPVFYVQYAHARISSLFRKAAEEGIETTSEADLGLLDADELALVKLAAQFPRVVESAAQAHEPHRIAFYLNDLAAAFHAQWNKGNDDPEKRFLLAQRPDLTRARLELASSIRQIIRNGLKLMGVAAAEEMH